MALVQLNFRLPKWQKRKLTQFAEDDQKTLEGFLQDIINEVLDERLEDLEAEARVIADYIDHQRTHRKFTPSRAGGQS